MSSRAAPVSMGFGVRRRETGIWEDVRTGHRGRESKNRCPPMLFSVSIIVFPEKIVNIPRPGRTPLFCKQIVNDAPVLLPKNINVLNLGEKSCMMIKNTE